MKFHMYVTLENLTEFNNNNNNGLQCIGIKSTKKLRIWFDYSINGELLVYIQHEAYMSTTPH